MRALLAVLAVFGLLVGWLLVQRVARVFATRHPQFGAAREEGGGCGGCGGGHCGQRCDETESRR